MTPIAPLMNWARHHTYGANKIVAPTTLEQLHHEIVQAKKIKTLGSRHSFNDIADTDGTLISLEHFCNVHAMSAKDNTVTVGAGIKYGALCQYLQQQGYALHNVASLPHISVTGACATATHGSGDKNACLAAAVQDIEMMTAEGEMVQLSRQKLGVAFDGMVVNLGALGVITKLTLTIQPTYDMQQVIYKNLPFARLEAHFDAITSNAYSVSLFTDWASDTVNQVWLKHRIGQNESPRDFAPQWLGAQRVDHPLHPIEALSPVSCTTQMGVRGVWHERLHHFRLDHTPSNGEELQSEYFVPRAHALSAIRTVRSLSTHLAPVLQISEIRTVAADSLWLSMCYQRDSVALHFTWKKDWDGVKQVLPLIEMGLAPYSARPHWGKLFTMPQTQLQSLYPRITDFIALARYYDPNQKMQNTFLTTVLGY
jgi:xylitol oxidase